jgi:tetratricopeptide (TPR) repeat protein
MTYMTKFRLNSSLFYLCIFIFILLGKTKIATQSKTDQDLKTLVDPNNILVWLDSEKALLSDGYPNTMIQLRQIFETIHTLNDREQCIKIIKENGDKNIFLIISGAFGQELVPNIHQMSQLNAIFVFCGNKPRHELWARQYIKVNGVFTEIALLCEAVKQIVKQQATSIRIIARNDETTKQNPDQIDRSLLYIQILKEIILQIRFDDRDIADFITYCRQKFAGNDRELKDCDKLEQEYHSHTPVWWYTYECFLYPMLNKALQILDVDVIIKMGFFIQNLHRQIEKLHSEQFRNNQKSEVFVVYRGQGLPTTDFQQLMQSKGGLLSFNNFSLTSKNRDTSLSFARDALNNPGSHGILFSMRIDPSIPFVPYASIDNIACSNTDDEILFSIHTIFRIIDIKQIDNNARLWQIDLTLINDNDSQIHLLTKHMQDETKGPTGWHRLGKFLSKIGLFDKAEELFNVLLSQTNEDREVAILYNQLGLIKNKKQDYSAAVKFYEQAIEIWKKSASPNNPDLAECYSNIGSVYVKMGERSKVISCYEQAVDIGKRSQSPNLQQWQKTLDNIKNNSK